MGEVLFHIFLIAVMGVFFNQSFEISSGRTADPIGPAGFPQGVIVIILILLIISLFTALRKMKTKDGIESPLHLNGMFFGLLASIVVFIFLNEVISFTLASIVFCFSLFLFLGQRKYLKMTINSVIVAVIFTFVFGKILTVPLPRGMGVIRELSYLFY